MKKEITLIIETGDDELERPKKISSLIYLSEKADVIMNLFKYKLLGIKIQDLSNDNFTDITEYPQLNFNWEIEE